MCCEYERVGVKVPGRGGAVATAAAVTEGPWEVPGALPGGSPEGEEAGEGPPAPGWAGLCCCCGAGYAWLLLPLLLLVVVLLLVLVSAAVAGGGLQGPVALREYESELVRLAPVLPSTSWSCGKEAVGCTIACPGSCPKLAAALAACCGCAGKECANPNGGREAGAPGGGATPCGMGRAHDAGEAPLGHPPGGVARGTTAAWRSEPKGWRRACNGAGCQAEGGVVPVSRWECGSCRAPALVGRAAVGCELPNRLRRGMPLRPGCLTELNGQEKSWMAEVAGLLAACLERTGPAAALLVVVCHKESSRPLKCDLMDAGPDGPRAAYYEVRWRDGGVDNRPDVVDKRSSLD